MSRRGQLIGLAIAILIGLAIAFFPFYAEKVAPYIWSYSSSATGGEYGTTTEIKGKVENVDAVAGTITVNGEKITFKGTWDVSFANGTKTTLESSQLLEYIRPGDTVTVKCTHTGRWGYMAEEVATSQFTAVKTTG